ncbi:MAG: hypothetical protein O3A92_02170 [Verrucomicrobia bacterium]|nr:hypothetical protein [Verrucomicrobiota bacterium]
MEWRTDRKDYPPDQIDFLDAVGGGGVTWVFWVAIIGWGVWSCWRVGKAEGTVSPLGIALVGVVIGVTWAIVEMALSVVLICELLTSTGAYSPAGSVSDLWYAAYSVLWVILEAYLVSAVVFGYAVVRGRRKEE